MTTLPLTVAKTARPQTLRAEVDRQRLFRLLDSAVREPVTVICAGAGWGKTTLVSAWAQSRKADVAWLSLDRHDNEPELFWAYVLAALRVAGAVTGDNPLAGMSSVPADERERGRRLAAGLGSLPEDTVLVLDDFHEIDDPRVLAEMNDLLRHPPGPLRIVLVTRTEPQLSLHRLRTAGRVAEIRTGHLAFTGAEATALVGRHGLDLKPADLSTLLERTEGWAVGLHLGAGFLAEPGGSRSIADFAGDVRGIDQYLIEEVLTGRSRRQRRFLLQTSICERVCADLASAITNQEDAQRVLEQLENDNNFVVRLGAKPLWFRYHHLLREALEHRLARESPGTVTELHRRAARWYAANNSVMEALTHAAAARDWQYIGRTVTAHASHLVVSSHRAALIKILNRIPVDRLTSTPELMVCGTLLLFHAGDFDALPARVARAREMLRRRPDDLAGRQAETVLLALQQAADRAVGDMPAVITGNDAILELLGAADGAAAAQQRAVATNNRGLARLWTGEPDAAGRDLWAGVSGARAGGVELTEINATGHLALLQVLCGSVREAAQLAGAARDLAAQRGWQYTLQAVAAHLAQALVDLEHHDLDAAEESLRHGIRAHQTDREAALLLVIRGIQARLAIARGVPARARVFVDEARRERSARLVAPALDRWLTIIEAEVDLATGHPEQVGPRFTTPTPAQVSRHSTVPAARADPRPAGTAPGPVSPHSAVAAPGQVAPHSAVAAPGQIAPHSAVAAPGQVVPRSVGDASGQNSLRSVGAASGQVEPRNAGRMFDLDERVVRARAIFATQSPRRAEEQLATEPDTLPQTAATVAAGVLGALLADAHGDATRAVDLLAEAVALAAREGIRRPFATHAGGRLDDLLDRLRLLDPGRAPLVDEIVRGTTNHTAAVAAYGLSEREAEVLRYLPTMLTAAEIAVELGVSVNTVKAHMRAIYRKLGAGRRSEAVTLGRDNGFL
ncbi:LuxR C-terminal-related transcriptional regulator [Actinoplanes sp. NBC_00393]|uniref:LuxR C-terminal-related transcriptional regulator n=1 Tax=Actinoplanes sp. NBC_00393 TaxID=2975953 RepID=UPI002E1E0D24